MVDMKKNNYQFADYIRVVAIFQVICCHCCHILDITSYCSYSVLLSRVSQSIGCLGVILFFILAGFNFDNKKDSFGVFWKKKCKSILVPWLVTSFLVYLYELVRKGGFSIEKMLNEILGTTSYTWFLTVLCLMYLLYWKITNIMVLWGLTCLSFVCILIHNLSNGMSGMSYFGNVIPIKWIPYFGLGMLLKYYFDSVLGWCHRLRVFFWMILMVCLGIVLVYAIEEHQVTYFTSWFPIYALLGAVSIWGILLQKKEGKYYQYCKIIANLSFSIYLLHMPIAGVCAFVMNGFFYSPIVLRPVLVLSVTIVGIYLLRMIAKHINVLQQVDLCIGYRER